MSHKCDSFDEISIGGYKFLTYKIGNTAAVFSTGEGSLDFNKNTDEGIHNMELLKKWFNVKEVGWLRQIHSRLVFDYDGNIYSGDGLITNKRNVAVGVFTADCVPVLMCDTVKGVVAAVHSGWRGTLKCIAGTAVNKMIDDYGCNASNINVFIGPHIEGCCYEVGADLMKAFKDKFCLKDDNNIQNNKLDLEKCIINDLKNNKVTDNNIYTMGICTYCSKKYHLHSYRRNNQNTGRMFSFIYIN